MKKFKTAMSIFGMCSIQASMSDNFKLLIIDGKLAETGILWKRYDLESYVKDVGVDEYTLYEHVNSLGESSAKAQHLRFPITTVDLAKRESNHLYLLYLNTLAIGILKIGMKVLWIPTKECLQKCSKLCVLDFFVTQQFERSGYGKVLFDVMLEEENTNPEELWYDKPSTAFLGFLERHYSLKNHLLHFNHFATFSEKPRIPAGYPSRLNITVSRVTNIKRDGILEKG